MTDANAGRRIYIEGDEATGYQVYSIEPDGHAFLLPCRSVTITVHEAADGKQSAVAMCYFTSPELRVTAPRHADGVRAG